MCSSCSTAPRWPLRDGPAVSVPVVEHILDLERRGVQLHLTATGLEVSPARVLTTRDRIFLKEHREDVCALVRYIDRLTPPVARDADDSTRAVPQRATEPRR